MSSNEWFKDAKVMQFSLNSLSNFKIMFVVIYTLYFMAMKYRLSLINAGFLITTLIVAISCSKVKTAPPEESTLDTLIEPPLSVIYVPVQYRVSGFEDLINNKVHGTFFNKWMNLNQKGDSLHLEISKLRRISLKRENRTINIVIPLKISGKVRAKVVGIKIKNETPVEAEINIHLSTTLHFDSLWNLVAESELKKIDWVKEPKVKIGFVKLNLRGQIEKILENKESHILDKADAAVKQILNTQKVAADIWRDIQKPIRINKKGVEIWLKPYAVSLSGRLEDTESDLISMMFELKTFTRIYFDDDSIPPSNPVVPSFKKSASNGDSLNIYVHSLIRFDMLNRFLNRELMDKPLSAKGFSTTIKKVRVYGTPTGLAIELKVKGDVDGTLYVKGTPVFDSLTNKFSLKDFDFDISTENSLLSSADWLLHSTALDLVSEKLNIDVSPLVAKLPEIIFQAIEKGKTGQKIDLNFNKLTLHPQIILTTKNNIQVLVLARGKATVVLNDKLFNKNDKKVSIR
jgi:hypothetical protein